MVISSPSAPSAPQSLSPKRIVKNLSTTPTTKDKAFVGGLMMGDYELQQHRQGLFGISPEPSIAFDFLVTNFPPCTCISPDLASLDRVFIAPLLFAT